MAQIDLTAMSVPDIHAALSDKQAAIRIHADAAKRGMTLSRYLEVLNPSDPAEKGGLDAFGRQMKAAGIVARSDPFMGYWASRMDEAFDPTNIAGRALYPEFFAREWRKVSFATRQERAVLLSSDSIIGGWDKPYSDAATARWQNQVQAPIPLAELIAMTTPVTGKDYRAIYLTYDTDDVRMVRVGEAADIPVGYITTADQAIVLHKHGRGLLASYEELRELRVDKLAWFIRLVAVHAEVDKVAAALTVIISGDGNSNGATNSALNTHDAAAVSGTLTLKGFLSWEMDFEAPYVLTTMLSTKAVALQLRLLNIGSANVPLAGSSLGGAPLDLRAINRTAQNVAYGWTTAAPANTIVGIDATQALEYVTQIGATISETERYIENQTQLMTMTEVDGFAVLDKGAAKTLTLTF